MSEITVLNPVETESALASHRSSRTDKIATSLASVIDTDASVFVTDMTESALTALRTRMRRANVNLSIRKVTHGTTKGHVIMARSV